MFIRITEKVLSNMEKQNMIQTDQRSIYMYGINQMLNILLNILTYLVIGLIFHMTLETIIFTCAYIPLRIYAGGFHAKNSVQMLDNVRTNAVCCFIFYEICVPECF